MTGIESADGRIELSEMGICSGTRIESSGAEIGYDGGRIKSRGVGVGCCEVRIGSCDIKIKCLKRGLNTLAKAVVA